ncbi:1-phosphofructokinase [Blattamonas nauphoetae]|uniref:1-phosphofructokinase n=1 Tax=Blattamonas nauphoetae TaxID=2049346 RepID=A0ABQ9X8I5_9EUKA|nr:1-phosphofructokinase [Blattamonas nauphoetae]
MSTLPIICVSYNPCIDRTLQVEYLKEGKQNKATYVSEQAAGKAINIAYIFGELNIPCAIYGFIGLDSAVVFDDRLKKVDNHMRRLPIRTRTNTTMIDDIQKIETYVREIGTPLDVNRFQELIDEVLSVVQRHQWVVLSGSLPPEVPVSLLGHFIIELKKKGAQVAVDTSGEALRVAVDAEPTLIKPNREELCSLVGDELFSNFGITQSAEHLHHFHPMMDILLSDGQNGCYYFADQIRLHALFEPSIVVPIVSTIGSGDALLAGFLAKQLKGHDNKSSLVYAVRIATSTLPNVCAGDIDMSVVNSENFEVTITDI